MTFFLSLFDISHQFKLRTNVMGIQNLYFTHLFSYTKIQFNRSYFMEKIFQNFTSHLGNARDPPVGHDT